MRHENLTLYTKLICIALLCEYVNVNSNTAICHLCISDFILKQRFFATPSAKILDFRIKACTCNESL